MMAVNFAGQSSSALLAFRAENVRSFRDEFEFSLVATKLAEAGARRPVAWRQDGKEIDVLTAAGIFGANASGKSNVLRAMSDMRYLVLNSFRQGRPGGGMPQRPFLLSTSSRERPSRFEIDLVLEGVRHQYGFSYDNERVVDEWAVRAPKGRSVLLFSRHGDELELGTAERAKGRAVQSILRPNALFLSTAASGNHPLLLPLYSWFERNLLLAEARSRDLRQALTAQMLEDSEMRERVLDLLREADLGIAGAVRRELDPEFRDRMERAAEVLFEGLEDDMDERPKFEPIPGTRLLHVADEGSIELDDDDESLGTLVWFGIVGPILRALRDGSVFLADELDASLHPVLVAHVIALFLDPETNPRKAQLVFNSHDITLLGDSSPARLHTSSDRLLGRDQIWFSEKTNDGATRVYPLADYGPRKDESIERRYLAGRYGGIPIVSGARMKEVVEQAVQGHTAHDYESG